MTRRCSWIQGFRSAIRWQGPHRSSHTQWNDVCIHFLAASFGLHWAEPYTRTHGSPVPVVGHFSMASCTHLKFGMPLARKFSDLRYSLTSMFISSRSRCFAAACTGQGRHTS